jgi:hypothetical protein
MRFIASLPRRLTKLPFSVQMVRAYGPLARVSRSVVHCIIYSLCFITQNCDTDMNVRSLQVKPQEVAVLVKGFSNPTGGTLFATGFELEGRKYVCINNEDKLIHGKDVCLETPPLFSDLHAFPLSCDQTLC